MISLRADITDLSRLFASLVSYARVSGPATALQLLKHQVLTYTAAGRTAMGARMPDYSAAHAKKRAAAGKQTAHVDLDFSGGMMKSVGVYGGNTLTVSAEYMERASGLAALKGDIFDVNPDTNTAIENTLAKGVEGLR
jgi:hypothetical protein